MENDASRTQFNNHEMEIIEWIIINLAIVLDNCIKDLRNPERIMKKYYYINSSEANITRAITGLVLANIINEKGAYREMVKKTIIETSPTLFKRSQEIFLANPSNLSKILREFEDAGISFRLTGKKEIKKESPNSVQRKNKAEPYERKKIVLIKLKPTVEEYKKMLSNRQALDLINNTLRKYRLLEKTYDLILENAFYAFKQGDDKWYDFLQAFKVMLSGSDQNAIPDSRLFRKGFNLLGNNELEELRKGLVQRLLDTPISSVFFTFSLARAYW